MSRFTKVLVANRGEIACRVIRSAQAAGYSTVAVFSEADAAAPHVRLADQSLCIGPALAAASYLDAAKVLDAAARTGADAIHPGYGFLSENAEFAKACERAGITFIGPSSEAIAVMGDKARAKAHMEAAGVPCVPGHRWQDQAGADLAELRTAADVVGYPLLVKASAGGGGRGMRRVDSGDELESALASARLEAEAAFGCGDLLLEKLIEGARHVEVQVMADEHGTTLHLGERDCSVQRRHQKVIEESPCPAVDEVLRQRMGAAAVEVAAAVDYRGAGTVEFLLAADGSFYFLEMNTRLQVEHPVTELVTGLDLVELQLRVAAGDPLGLAQADVQICGHAIEARLYAEDPERGYMPQTGRVELWRAPMGEGVRCDAGIRAGQDIGSFYDPMLAKIIASGPDRATALRRLRRALRATILLGVQHNAAFLDRVLGHAVFAAGTVTTSFLEREFAAGDEASGGPSPTHWALAAHLFVAGGESHSGWRSSATSGVSLVKLRHGERSELIRVTTAHGARHQVQVGDTSLSLVSHGADADRISVDGICAPVAHAWSADHSTVHLAFDGATHSFDRIAPGSEAEEGPSDGRVRSPLAGRVAALHVELGDEVIPGQSLLVLEAMKLETVITSPCDGTVQSISAGVDEQVARRQLLVVVEPSAV